MWLYWRINNSLSEAGLTACSYPLLLQVQLKRSPALSSGSLAIHLLLKLDCTFLQAWSSVCLTQQLSSRPLEGAALRCSERLQPPWLTLQGLRWMGQGLVQGSRCRKGSLFWKRCSSLPLGKEQRSLRSSHSDLCLLAPKELHN